MNKAQEILGVVLPANEDSALPLHPGEEAIKAQELSGVVWRKEWDVSEMNSGTIYIYHPLKDRDFARLSGDLLACPALSA